MLLQEKRSKEIRLLYITMALLLVAVAVTGATIGIQYVHALPHTHHGASKAMTSSTRGPSSSNGGSSSGGSYY